MKILYVVTRGDVIGGASMHVLELASEMQRRGAEVVLVLGPGQVVAELAARRGLPVITEPSLVRHIAPWHDLRCLWRLRKLMQQIKPDLVHLHSAKAGILGRLVARQLRIPVMYSVHGWAFSMSSGLTARAYQWLERRLLSFTDMLVLVCQRDLTLARQLAAGRKVRLALVHNGIDETSASCERPGRDDFATSQLAVSELAANESAASDLRCRLISVARFEAPKDHTTLLHALARLPAASWQLQLVGSGPLLAGCQQLAQQLGLSQIEFLGERQDVPALLQQADIFVLSSRSESLPVSVLEAMRAGLPVVATDVGGLSELVAPQNGYLVPAGDRAALGDALAALITDSALRQQMGQQGACLFQTHFTLSQHAEKLHRLYLNMLEAA